MSGADGRLGKRLQRILLLLPYAIKHPGVSVDELSAKFDVKKKDLLDDLNLVFMCGLPGYGPGDLIDVSLEDDRIYVRMADYFSAPLKLTPAEALALYAGSAAIVEVPEMNEADALKRALAKLARAIGMDEEGGPGIEVTIEDTPHRHLKTIQAALSERKKVHMEYFTAARAEMTERSVEPWSLIAIDSRWYLLAMDDRSGEERMFRVDRIKEARLLEESYDIPDDIELERYTSAFVGDEGKPSVTFEISPQTARWFEDHYATRSAEDVGDGWRRVEVESSSPFWMSALLLQLGTGVRSVEPPEALEDAKKLAREILARHR
jgi:proteasome accessory factor C